MISEIIFGKPISNDKNIVKKYPGQMENKCVSGNGSENFK